MTERPRLHTLYQSEIRPALMKEFSYTNTMMVPALSKIVVSMGIGEATKDRKKLQNAVEALTLIAGQKPVTTLARKSEAAFKLRAGMAIGCKVTLRRWMMYEFLDRLVTIALPRVRDFRGLSPRSFDGHGNYNMGLAEQIVFPEIDYDSVDDIHGMNITICSTAQTDAEALALLRAFNMPLRQN